MSDPVSSMDVEDVLSSIRRLVSEEAKGFSPADPSTPPTGPANIHEAAENAVSDAIAQMGSGSFGVRPSNTPPSNDLADDPAPASIAEEQVEPQVPFRHKSVSKRPLADQKLVLTAALRVTPQTENKTTDDVAQDLRTEPPLETTSDQPEASARETVTSEASIPRPQRPHLRPVENDAPLRASRQIELPENSSASEFAESDDPVDSVNVSAMEDAAEIAEPVELADGSGAKAFEYAPEDTLFARAKQAMDSVKAAKSEEPEYVFSPELDAPQADAPEIRNAVVDGFFAKPQQAAEVDVSAAPNYFAADEAGQASNPLRMDTVQKSVAGDQAQGAAYPEMSDQFGETEVDESTPETGEDTQMQSEPEAAESSASPFNAAGGMFGAAKGAPTDEGSDAADGTYFDEPSTINFAEEEDSILDEDTLRDLVSEMVREELQGELGDRITRNVRKLVRREIQRALASREFE